MTEHEALAASRFLRETGELMTILQVADDIARQLHNRQRWDVCETSQHDDPPGEGWEPYGAVAPRGTTYIQWRRRTA